MKKICYLLSCLILLQLLMGCSNKEKEILQPVNLYYINSEISYNTENGVIATLKFRILEDCKPGTTALTLSAQAEEVYDADLQPVDFEIKQGVVTIEKEKTVSYDATTGTVTLYSLPENTETVFIAAYKGGRMISVITGTLGCGNEVPSAADADEIKVFYLGDNYQPSDGDSCIDLS